MMFTIRCHRWGAENQLQVTQLRGNNINLHARSARTSVTSTPFCILKDTIAEKAIAFHFLPHGNWNIQIHSELFSNEYPVPIVEAGLSDEDLAFTLNPNENILLPEVLLQEVKNGNLLNFSGNLHDYLNNHVIPSSLLPTPVVYNSWLYKFTSFTKEELLLQAKAAKEIGCETFVVDAGWYGYDQEVGKVG